MKLSEAIKTIDFEDKATLPPRNDDLWDAIRLGNEAIKQIRQIRAYAKELFLPLLPGEDKE